MSVGLGVMIKRLSNNEPADLTAYIGRKIERAIIIDECLWIDFAEAQSLVFKDQGQSCCELRYMKCDDDLSHFKGTEFRGVEIRDGGEVREKGGEEKECEFLIVNTSSGSFTIANYNEHNGYYGGFHLEMRRSKIKSTEKEQ